jgi:hypothetical protein
MEKTTNIRRVADRIMRHPLLRDVPFETILDYTVDFLQIVGVPSLFEEKTALLHVENYRCMLPCDYVSMIQVRTAKKVDGIEPNHRSHISYRYSTDSFHMSNEKPDVGRYGTDLTYKIQGCVIYTSTKDTDIEIAYNAIATDDEGYPLLPDNPSFLRALEAYVKKQQFTILFDLGKLQPAILQNAQQEYAFYVGQCQTDMIMPSIDQMESLTNLWTALIARANEHSKGFINSGSKEYLTVQS